MSKTVAGFINNVLASVVFVLAFFIIFSPFLPEIQLAVSNSITPDGLKVISGGKPLLPVPAPEKNTLVIADIGVHGIIYEGDKVETMNKGIWRRPHSSDPTRGGNTVLVAHRYLYTSGPDTFYHLPKVDIGKHIILYWNGKKYEYKVFETKVVDPDEVEIEKDTLEPTLTLYTCTPLWTSAKRFVVRAKPVSAK